MRSHSMKSSGAESNEAQGLPGNDDSELAGRPSRDLLVAAHQAITRDWWESRRSAFELYVSQLVIQEVQAGDTLLANRRLEILRDLPVLAVSPEILNLAEDITEGPIPRKAAGDAA